MFVEQAALDFWSGTGAGVDNQSFMRVNVAFPPPFPSLPLVIRAREHVRPSTVAFHSFVSEPMTRHDIRLHLCVLGSCHKVILPTFSVCIVDVVS